MARKEVPCPYKTNSQDLDPYSAPMNEYKVKRRHHAVKANRGLLVQKDEEVQLGFFRLVVSVQVHSGQDSGAE